MKTPSTIYSHTKVVSFGQQKKWFSIKKGKVESSEFKANSREKF